MCKSRRIRRRVPPRPRDLLPAGLPDPIRPASARVTIRSPHRSTQPTSSTPGAGKRAAGPDPSGTRDTVRRGHVRHRTRHGRQPRRSSTRSPPPTAPRIRQGPGSRLAPVAARFHHDRGAPAGALQDRRRRPAPAASSGRARPGAASISSGTATSGRGRSGSGSRGGGSGRPRWSGCGWLMWGIDHRHPQPVVVGSDGHHNGLGS